MKVFFDTEIFRLQGRGGISNYWLELMTRFCDAEECTFYSHDIDSYKHKGFKKIFPKWRKETLSDKDKKPLMLKLINPPKMREKNPVIFHGTTFRYVKQKNVKNIVTIHDFTHQKKGKGFHKILNSFLKIRAIKHASGIVCISNNTYDDLLKFYPKAKNKKCAVIYNGYNSDVFHHIDKVKLPEKYEVLNEKKFILFVGLRGGYKNFEFIIEVMKKTNDLDLCVVGGGFLDLETNGLSSISDRIHCFTNVDDDELNLLYNKCFCFIYPSLYEGFGIPICEAMNCGCPVIAFNNSSIPEVMNGAGILLDDNDLDSTLLYLKKLEDNVYREEIIQKQYIACSKFSWDKAYSDMHDFYEKVLNDD